MSPRDARPGWPELPAGLDVAVLHDPVPDDAPPDRRDTLVQADETAAALAGLGLAPRLVPFGPDMERARETLGARPPALALNLVEGVAGLESMAFAAPAMLEALGVPFTGSDARALLAAARKSAAKRLLRQAGLSTPDWLCAAPRPGDPTPAVRPDRPFIIKPEFSHGSVGIGPEAVVHARDAAGLAGLLAAREAALGCPCLAEAFIAGREFSVSVIQTRQGPLALPPAQMRFSGPTASGEAFLSYAAKWNEKSAAYEQSNRAFPTDEPALLRALREAALSAWRVFGLGGYARFDFRVPEGGGAPLCIDVNANPCLARDAGLAAAAEKAGVGYAALVAGICAAGLGAGKPSPEADAARKIETGWRTEVLQEDPEAIRRLVEATGFFNAEEIVIAGDLATEYLAKGEASGYAFMFAVDRSGDRADRLAGYACFGPTPGTADSFDLYWIAVDPARQGKGLGGAILRRAEEVMGARGAHGVYVETSSRGQYEPTRRFYEKHGYALRARLEGFYQTCDDKMIYVKRLDIPGHTEQT